MATTPPPPSVLRTPPTPRFGAGYDQYEPYATRHSARIAGQRSSRESRSTSPGFPESDAQPQADMKDGGTLRGSGLRALSPPEASNCSPENERGPHASAFNREHSLSNTSDPFIAAPSPLPHQPSPQTHRAAMTEGMLPTPAKTPKKKAVGDAGSTARSLFPSSSTGRGKKSKKPTAFSLESFENDPGQNQSNIEIYTDSRDRIPELDESEENPFYSKPSGPSASGRTSARTSRARKAEDSKRDDEIDEALHRDDGMFYVFRGKRFFRKFDDAAENEADEDDDLGLLASRPDLVDSSVTPNTRPLTRSSVKPRVLFPGANDRSKEDAMDETDEEAATDIEDNGVSKDGADETDHAPDSDTQQDPATPSARSNVPTPAGPGATLRTLRSRTKRDVAECDVTPTASAAKRKQMSPFAGWQRKKQSPPSGATTPRKRDAGAGSPGEPVAKKTRSSRATVPS